MISIYKRLLKYQESSEKSNLENYLTEILCDYLSRISKNENRLFIKNIVFHSCNMTHFKAFMCKHKFDDKNTSIEWKTQYSINVSGTTKFPDLLGFINKEPAIIVEVKIGAAFTKRLHKDEMGNQVSTPQLKDYGNWLNQANSNGALVLLTYSTNPPDDYLGKTESYGIKQRSYITWQQIYNWLKKINHENHDNSGLYLTQDFMTFILENSMANESPNLTDFSALEIFISGSGERINGMMKFTREELEKKYKKNINWGKEKSYLNDGLYTVDYKQKLMWSWSILESKEYCFIAWGICYPTEKDEWEWRHYFPDIPKKPFVFIGVFSDRDLIKKNYNQSLDHRPEGWLWNNDINNEDATDLIGINTRPLDEFISYDDDTTTNFYQFIDREFKNALSLTDKIIVT